MVLLYNSKYRILLKKSHILMKKIEESIVKKLLNLSECQDEIKRLKETISCLHKEIILLKTIFGIKSDKDEIQRFIDEKERIKENDKAILKKSLGNVFKNKSLLDKIPQEKKVLIVKHFNLGKIN